MLDFIEHLCGFDRLFPQHSRDFAAAERVDVILHEQMGDFLLTKAWSPTFSTCATAS